MATSISLKQLQNFLDTMRAYVNTHFPANTEISVENIYPLDIFSAASLHIQNHNNRIYTMCVHTNIEGDLSSFICYYDCDGNKFIADDLHLFTILKNRLQSKTKSLSLPYKIYVDIYQNTHDTNPRTIDVTKEIEELASFENTENFIDTFFTKYFCDTDSNEAFAELRESPNSNPTYDFIHMEYHKSGAWIYV